MNPSFFLLEKDKQEIILDAGYQVFSRTTYKEANMLDIAYKAGISKSLLFYYFKNKKEFYLYLWNQAAEMTYEAVRNKDAYAKDSLFEMMDAGLEAKTELMKTHPHVARFALRALMEEDPDVHEAVQASYNSWFNRQAQDAIVQAGKNKIRKDIGLDELVEQMRLIGEGYVWRMQMADHIDLEQLTKDTQDMMEFWKKVYGDD